MLAGYLLAVNGAVHLLWAMAFRSYNPGLWTGVVAFLPLAFWIFATIPAPSSVHVVSLLTVIGLHAAIMILARRLA